MLKWYASPLSRTKKKKKKKKKKIAYIQQHCANQPAHRFRCFLPIIEQCRKKIASHMCEIYIGAD